MISTNPAAGTDAKIVSPFAVMAASCAWSGATNWWRICPVRRIDFVNGVIPVAEHNQRVLLRLRAQRRGAHARNEQCDANVRIRARGAPGIITTPGIGCGREAS